MELVNNLSWSASRARTLRSCARLYYLRYYLFWKGWEPDASQSSRLAYALSKMSDLPALAGEVVHETIAHHLRSSRDGHAAPLDPEAALRIMRGMWTDARRHWAKGPDSTVSSPKRHRPLAEIFYGEENEDPERLREIAARVPACLQAFEESAILARIREAGPGTLLWVEPPAGAFDPQTVLDVEGVPVHCVPDLVRLEGETIEIVDWKTGRPAPEDAEQVAAYGLWAIGKLGADPARLSGRLVYLSEGAREEPVPIDDDALEAAVNRIRTDLREMTDALARPEENLPRPMESFPRRDEAAVCGRCHFRVFCWPDGVTLES